MPSMPSLACGLLLLLIGPAEASRAAQGKAAEAARSAANPIRKVVKLLQNLEKKVYEEGEEGQKFFDKFECYCKRGTSDLDSAIQEAEDRIPQLESGIAEGESKLQQLDKELGEHQADRTEAKANIAKATKMRERDAATYSEESSKMEADIANLAKATASMRKGIGEFIQSGSLDTVQRLSGNADLSTGDREELASFLSQASDGQGEAPSNEIIGIMDQLEVTMRKDLAEVNGVESTALADFEALISAKEKEIDINTRAIEAKLERKGNLGVQVQTIREDLEDTSQRLKEDKGFVATLDTNCKDKKRKWEEDKKARSNELLAIGETIKILNADDSLDLFKKALPSSLVQADPNAVPSFLQVEQQGKGSGGAKQKAVSMLMRAAERNKKEPRLLLLATSLKGKKISLDKAIRAIDEITALLDQEQKDDVAKKDYCTRELDKSEDDLKGLQGEISDITKVEGAAEGSIESITKELTELEAGILALDKQVQEATETRKTENKQANEDLSTSSAAKELLEAALKRLGKLYMPQAPEASDAEKDEAGDGEMSFVQMSSRSDGPPPPPPATLKAYESKTEEGTGVIQMIRAIATDLSKEMTRMEVEEKNSQAEYEKLMVASAKKRAADAKSLAEKEGSKAELEVGLRRTGLEKKDKMKLVKITQKVLMNMHAECDWLLANFDVRKQARAEESESLDNAKAVLSGSDYSFMQVASTGQVRRVQ